MQTPLPLKPKMDIRASSSFTREQVETRIADLETRAMNGSLADSAKDEVAFLRGVLERMK